MEYIVFFAKSASTGKVSKYKFSTQDLDYASLDNNWEGFPSDDDLLSTQQPVRLGQNYLYLHALVDNPTFGDLRALLGY